MTLSFLATNYTNFTNRVLVCFTGMVLASLTISCTVATSTDVTSSDVLIEYRQSGGFAGLDDCLAIYADRRATLTRKAEHYEFVLAQEAFEALLRQLDQAEFSRLEREYLPADTCCDLIEYTITYKGHTVRTMDTAVPESLQPILNSLSETVETGKEP